MRMAGQRAGPRVKAPKRLRIGLDTRLIREIGEIRKILKRYVVRMAERVGFEPTVRFPARSLSRRVLSTAQPPLRGRCAAVTAQHL